MKKQKVSLKKISSWTIKSLIFAILLMIGFGYLFGYNVFIVNGWSAEPYIPYHSLIIVQKCSFNDIKVGTEANNYEDGDFVTFSITGISYVTHRVVAKDTETQVITTNGYQQGELQNSQEYPTYDEIVGRVVWHSYILGTLIYSFKSSTNLLLLVLMGGILLIYNGYYGYHNDYMDNNYTKVKN